MPDWSDEDFIRYVEWRVLEFEAARREKSKGIKSRSPDHPLAEQDLRIWLARHRDGLTLANIARKECAAIWRAKKGKRSNQGPISFVRRSLDRVERFLNRGEGKPFGYPKKMRDQLLEYLRSIGLD